MDSVYKISDDRFSVENIDQFELSMELSLSRLQFVIKKSDSQMIMWLEDHYYGNENTPSQVAKFVKETIKGHEFIAANFWKTINVNISTPICALVPNELNNENYYNQYISELFTKINLENYTISNDVLLEKRGSLVFAFPSIFQETLMEIYPKCKISCNYSKILNYFIQYKNIGGSNLLFIDNQYLMLTYFETKTKNLRFEIVNLDSKNFDKFIKMFLSNGYANSILFGELTPYSLLYKKLEKIAGKLSWGKYPNKLVISQYFEELPEHRYLSVFL